MKQIEWKQTGERVASRPLAGQQRRQTKVTQFDCAALSHQHIGTPTYTREEESGWWWRRLTWCRGARCWESVNRRVRAPIQPLSSPPSHLVQCNGLTYVYVCWLTYVCYIILCKPFHYSQILSTNEQHHSLYAVLLRLNQYLGCTSVNVFHQHPKFTRVLQSKRYTNKTMFIRTTILSQWFLCKI